MSGFQILMSRAGGPGAPGAPAGVVDVLVDGMNVTARVGESQTLPFLRDLAHAACDLASRKRPRATVPFYLYDDPWELGLVRDGAHLLLSVFRAGATPEVAVHERRVRGDELVAALSSALDGLVAADSHERADVAFARAQLAAAAAFDEVRSLPEPAVRTVAAPSDSPLGFACDLWLRDLDDEPSTVARSELLPLLVRGRLRVLVPGRERDLGESYVFLVVERLVELAEQVLDADARGTAYYRRFEVAGLRGAARLCEDGALGLTLRRPGDGASSTGETFPGLDAASFADAVVALGKGIARALVRSDRSQGQNLRLSSLRAGVKALESRLRPPPSLAPRVNDAPESYRAYAIAARKPANEAAPAPAKLRFSPRWSATVPGLDLGATFLCGDRIVATGSRELAALSRTTGDVLWQRSAPRAVAVPTPGGLARILPDGLLQLHDYGNGEIALAVRLAPRVGGPATGAVVHAHGLPKLLVVGEGDRYLSAVDLVSGEVRWRHTLARPGTARVRRAGKLLVETTGDLYLSAIDVQSGEVVWRLRDASPFAGAPTFETDALFVVVGDGVGGRRGRSRLLAIDAWQGSPRFDVELPSRVATVGQPLVTAHTVAVVTRDDAGLGLSGFDRHTGEAKFHVAPGACPFVTAWLAVDDAIFANTSGGELIAFDADRGEVRFRIALAPADAEATPRRLDPVLRSGALFVPQREVHVVRPRDGERLGQVPCDLVPDLLRVDERCDVYVAEESGHLAAFGAGARLSIVRA